MNEEPSPREIPSEFQTLRLKFGVERITNQYGHVPDGIPRVTLEMVEPWIGEVTETVDEEAEASSDLVRFRKGDVLFNKLRPYLAKAFEAKYDGAASPEFLVLKPEKFHRGYLLHLLLSKEFIDRVDASTYGAKMPRASWDFIGNIKVPCPSKSTQQEISDYLDSRTSDIDSLIKKKNELLSLLDETGESITTQIVTKGLGNKPLKESGIPTIGKIPEHWEVVPNRAVFEEVDDRSEDGSEELLTVSHKTGVTLRSEKDVNMFKADSLEGYKRTHSGDLVINTMWAWMGAVGSSPQLGLVSPSYHVYRPNELMNSEFADILYRTPPYVAEMGRHSKGVWKSRQRLYPDVFLRMDTILPPKPEQEEIVKTVGSSTDDVRELKQKLTNSVDLLREKRQTLVSRAVTGRIDDTVLELSEEQEATP